MVWVPAGEGERPFKMLVTGMSGTGKSCWMLYMLWRLAKADKTVLWQLDPREFWVINRSFPLGGLANAECYSVGWGENVVLCTLTVGSSSDVCTMCAICHTYGLLLVCTGAS